MWITLLHFVTMVSSVSIPSADSLKADWIWCVLFSFASHCKVFLFADCFMKFAISIDDKKLQEWNLKREQLTLTLINS